MKIIHGDTGSLTEEFFKGVPSTVKKRKDQALVTVSIEEVAHLASCFFRLSNLLLCGIGYMAWTELNCVILFTKRRRSLASLHCSPNFVVHRVLSLRSLLQINPALWQQTWKKSSWNESFSDRSCEKIGTYFRSGCSYSAFSKCCGILLQFRGSPTYQHIVTCAITAQRYVAWNVISPTQTPAASEVQKKLFSHSPLALIARQKSSIVGPPTSCQDWHRCQVRCRHSAIAGNIKWKPVHGSASIDHDHRWCSNKRSSSPQPGSGYAGDDQMDKGCCVTAKKAPLFWPYTTPLAGYIYSFSHTHDQGHLCWPGCLYDV